MNLFKKTALALMGLACMAPDANATGWPANYDGVMLQGFYWDSYSDTSWKSLTNQSDELAKYFQLIWIPNCAQAEGGNNMGYHPKYWFTHLTSSFGNETELRNMIKTFKSKGSGFIADVVINHRIGVTNWTDFPAEEWNGKTWKIGTDGICSTDEVRNAAGQAKPTGAADTGENWDGARDLDHTNANVQENCKGYLKFLLTDLGFEGVRYDFVKGYAPRFTKMYNQANNVKFSVGEYWDGSYDAVKGWIEGTGKESAAFDFPCKYQLNKAWSNGNMGELVWKANGTTDQPAGMIHFGYQQYAVTFVDNHDTYRDGSKFNGNVVAANAFILCSPGTPCVFYPHWKANKAAIKKLIAVRRSVGVTNTSTVNVLKSSRDCYMAEVTGKNGKLVVKIGSAQESPAGYSNSDIVASGTDYCVWTKVKVTDPQGGNQGGGDDPVTPPTTDAYTVYFDNSSSSWPTVNIYYWNSASDSSPLSWPGTAMQPTSEANIFKYTVPAGNDMVIFNNGKTEGELEGIDKTSDLTGVNNHLYTVSGDQGAYNGGNGGNDDPVNPPSGDYPATVYMVGHVNTLNWDSSQGVTPNDSNDGLYLWRNVNFDQAPATTSAPRKANSSKVYFDNSSSNWSAVNAYWWEGDDNNTWPGTPMTSEGNNIYSIAVPAGYTNIIFNNGAGSQTADLILTLGHIYNASGDQGEYSGGNDDPVNPPAADAGYFTFLTQLDANNGDWDNANQADRYGAASKDAPISVGSPVTVRKFAYMVDAMGAFSWMHNAGTYDALLNLKDMTLQLYAAGTAPDIRNSIASILDDEAQAPVVYYDLQGRIVAEPTPGSIYLRRQGSKVSKVIMR